MNLLDENIPDSQQQLLRNWAIRIHQVGNEVGYQGIKDMGKVVRITHMGLQMWQLSVEKEKVLKWPL